jgi:hypothetical protein
MKSATRLAFRIESEYSSSNDLSAFTISPLARGIVEIVEKTDDQ